MKRNFIYSLAATFITAALTLGSFTACSNEDLVTDVNTTQAKTYTVSIPASMGEDGTTRAVDFSGTDPVTGKPTAISSFKTTDKIYVYNQTKNAMLTGFLTPSADGKTCDLTGSLTGDIAAGDNLVLLYNLSVYDSEPTGCYFDYVHQNGTQAGVTDGATATVTASVENYDLTAATAHFQNVQSMFRFQFTSNGTPVNVKTVDISSQKDAIVGAYFPCVNVNNYVSLEGSANLPSATTDPIYVAMCIDESKSAGDVLTFNVVDATGKLYTTSKAASNSGFVNGKYYYNSSAIDLGDYKLQLVKPTLSRSDGGKESELTDADALQCFQVYSPSLSGVGAAQGITMSMSGTSTGYWFCLWSDAGNTVNMSGLTATYDESAYYIDSYNSLTLNISGDNTITCKNYDYCVLADDDLKLSGNGTLTVTANSATDYGLWADNYNGSDVSALAADGYTVTRSATQDNGDGTYTWTYTVRPLINLSSVTTTDTNGKLYYAAENGDVLTGSFTDEAYVTIPDGATITLSDVHIQAPYNCDHAAIHCLGSANIIVSGTSYNDVYAGHSSSYPAIYVPSGKTLTISGSSELWANGNYGTGAGIGGGYIYNSNTPIPCGNIVLNGGTIEAEGGQFSAGIGGGGAGFCGNITINGATVRRANGGTGGAGIGSGIDGSCGDITISSGSVGDNSGNSACGGESAYGIGCGQSGSCGKITIGSDVTEVNVRRWIGGEYGKIGTVTIDGVQLTDSQIDDGVNSRLTDVSPVFPHLNSQAYFYSGEWTLWK